MLPWEFEVSVHRPPRPGKVVCAIVKHVDCMYVGQFLKSMFINIYKLSVIYIDILINVDVLTYIYIYNII